MFKLFNKGYYWAIKSSIFFICLIGLACAVKAQGPNPSAPPPPLIKDFFMSVDTNEYQYSQDKVSYQQKDYLMFQYYINNEVAEFVLQVFQPENIAKLKLVRSADFEMIDSLVMIEGKDYRGKIRFSNLANSHNISLVFAVTYTDSREANYELKLLPTIPTIASLKLKDDDLYVGEPRIMEIISNRPENIRADNNWINAKLFDYKVYYEDQQLRIQVLPKFEGRSDFNLILETRKPLVNDSGKISTRLPLIKQSFHVKQGRLGFLSFEPKDVTLETNFGKGIEVQIENNRNLQLKKTYRIENQLESGGAFIGEIYIRSLLSNDRVLCYLRPYALHRLTEGYLYLKDGDEPKFITNFSISERTQITKVTILREGLDWSTNLNVNPGETVELRIEGTGLTKAKFQIEDISEIKRDSSLTTENVIVLKFRVPLNITKRKINIFNNRKNTSYDIQIKEYQNPRQLDFVSINYAGQDIPLSELGPPRMHDKTIPDITVGFNPNKIDAQGKLFGKQYLIMDVSYFNNRGELIETKQVNDILICPGESSPRTAFYNDRDCDKNDISINSIMSRKTYDLNDWSRIEIVIKHKPEAYGGVPGYSRKVILILQKHQSFDIDVSLPSGLLTKKVGDNGFGSFSGISLAILAQFSFYKPDKIEKLRPYKVGAGVLALNAFNFSSDNSVNRDLAMVAIGSLVPPTRNSKISFNLYGGFGFFVVSSRFFFVLGPGIQLRL